MGKGKGHFNQDLERARQEKNRIEGKYGNPTAVRLKVRANLYKTIIMLVIVVLLEEH